MNNPYQDLLRAILRYGTVVNSRNGQTKRLTARLVQFTTTPLVSVRKTAWKTSLREWEWFMSGSDAIEDLHPSARHWWEPWAKEYPDGKHRVRFNYGHQFRCASGSDGGASPKDQVRLLVDGIREHPNSRRNLITTWNTADMTHPSCPITNCHGTVIQAFVEPAGLALTTYQRSADVVCGLPHNWIQYWAFLLWLAHQTGQLPLSLTWIGGDCHIYQQHYELAQRIVDASAPADAPGFVYRPTGQDFKADDFTLTTAYIPVLTENAEMVV